MKSIKLVMAGSGTIYPIYAGAIQKLSELGIKIKEICAVSGGSIIAAALASGYKPGKQLNDLILNNLPYENDLWDWSWWPIQKRRYGFINGDKIEQKFKDIFVSDFSECSIPIHIIASDIESKKLKVFNKNTKNVKVSEAIRASISIPFLFKIKEINNKLYIDGGVVSNFPLDFFGNKSKETLGLKVKTTNTRKKIRSLFSYVFSIIGLLVSSIENEHIEDALWAKTIYLKSNINSLDLQIDKGKAKLLIKQGYKTVENWFKKGNNIA